MQLPNSIGSYRRPSSSVSGTPPVIVTPTPTPTIPSYWFNYSSSQLDAWRAKRAAGPTRVLAGFDSTSTSVGGGSGPDGLTGAAPTRTAHQFATKATAAGATSVEESIIGDGGIVAAAQGGRAQLLTYDTRLGLPSDWQINDGGAGKWYQNASSTAPFTFAPASAVRYWDVYVAVYGGGGTITATVGGNLPVSGGTINTAASNEIKRFTVDAGTNTTGTLALTCAGSCILIGVQGRTATGMASASISIIGAQASRFTSTSTTDIYQAGSVVLAYGADLTFINIGLNDSYYAVDPATYQANVTQMVANAQATGQAVLVFPQPRSEVDDAHAAPYITAMQNVAVAKNCPMINEFARGRDFWTPYVYGGSGPHLTAAGYGLIADDYVRMATI